MFVKKPYSPLFIFSFKTCIVLWIFFSTNVIAQHAIPQTTLKAIYKTHTYHVYVFKSKSNRGNLLFLHGWHLPASDWWLKTNAIDSALNQGYNCICPDLDKCCYNDSIYNETDPRYLEYPTRTWIRQVLMPLIQSEGYLTPQTPNAVVGISTGCRGAVLLAADYPDVFKKALLLSGDYDQTQMPQDGLMTACYGKYTHHKNRWLKIDNPLYKAKDLKCDIILVHGLNDKIVPYKQSQSFYKQLKKLNKNAELFVIKNAAHDYVLWNTQIQQKLKLLWN
jgi:pimeloyl-ACP methyl ester carboxylesterase